jgi:5-methyltetrahydropteroyltriglutamate--homocysteine methyltransferase
MPIPTEQIGSVPRSPELLQAMQAYAAGQLSDEQLQAAQEAALGDTISRLEARARP